MLRNDGTIAFYIVEMRFSLAGDQHRWSKVDLGHVIFSEMDRDTARGPEGDRLRALLSLEGASTDLWQRYGVNGFADEAPAHRAMDEAGKARPKATFRVVRRVITQTTQVVT